MSEPDRHIEIRESFGCEACYHAPAEVLWQNARSFDLLKQVVEAMHFGVALLACRSCGQRWVKVFCETIDWEKGQDPQHWAMLPLTAEEAGPLAAQGEDDDLLWIEPLARDRRHLAVDYPKSGDMTIAWVAGPMPVTPAE